MTISIHIFHDDSPENPFEAWDTEPPILVCYDQRFFGYGLGERCPRLTEAAVRKHWREMVSTLTQGSKTPAYGRRIWFNYSPDKGGLTAFARAEYDVHGYPLREVLADAVAEEINGTSGSDKLKRLATAYRWLGMPAYVRSSVGYSQGDWSEVLVVWTPEWVKRMGIKPETLTPAQIEESMQATVSLYGAWAWGDVYGWVLADLDESEDAYPSPTQCIEGVPVYEQGLEFALQRQINSCWGYYGDDFKESSLLGDAVAAARHEQRRRAEVEAEADASRLKEAQERQFWAERDVMTI